MVKQTSRKYQEVKTRCEALEKQLLDQEKDQATLTSKLKTENISLKNDL